MALWRGRRGSDEGGGNASFSGANPKSVGGGSPGDTSSSGVVERGGDGGNGHTEAEEHRQKDLKAAAPAPAAPAGEYKQQVRSVVYIKTTDLTPSG